MKTNCFEYRKRKIVQLVKLAMDVSEDCRDLMSVSVHYNGHCFDSVVVIFSFYSDLGIKVTYHLNYLDASLNDSDIEQIIYILKQIKLAVEAGRMEVAA